MFLFFDPAAVLRRINPVLAALVLSSGVSAQSPDRSRFDATIGVVSPTATLPGRDHYPLLGSAITLAISALDGDTVAWSRSGLPIASANTAELHIATLTAADTGNYRAHITRDGFTYTSNPFTLNVAIPVQESIVDRSFSCPIATPNADDSFDLHLTRFDGAIGATLHGLGNSRQHGWIAADGSRFDVIMEEDGSSPASLLVGMYPDGSLVKRTTTGFVQINHDGTTTAMADPTGRFDTARWRVRQSDGGWIIGDSSHVAGLAPDGTITFERSLNTYGVLSIEGLEDAGLEDDRIILISGIGDDDSTYARQAHLLEADGSEVVGFHPIIFRGSRPVPLANGTWWDDTANGFNWYDPTGQLIRSVPRPPALSNTTVAPDGRLYVRGFAGELHRLLPDLSRDPTWMVSYSFGRWIDDFLFQPNGGIIVAGDFSNVGGHATRRVARLNASGTANGGTPVVYREAPLPWTFPGTATVYPYSRHASFTIDGEANGVGPLQFEWLRLDDGPPPQVRDQADLVFPRLTADYFGSYQLKVTGPHGFALSDVISLTPPGPALVNISGRGRVSAQTGQHLIAGFVIESDRPTSLQGAWSAQVFTRGVGPTLADFNVSHPLPDPFLRMSHLFGADIAVNDDWQPVGGPFFPARLGAFSLRPDSADAQLWELIPTGAFTSSVEAKAAQNGTALVEIYPSLNIDARLTNLSLRGRVGAGDDVLISGFVITDITDYQRTVRLLIRAVGPALSNFGVADACLDPRITLFNADGEVIALNEDWAHHDAVQIATLAAQLGAFPLPLDSTDAALLVELAPGAYTAHIDSSDGTDGEALLELYVIDDE